MYSNHTSIPLKLIFNFFGIGNPFEFITVGTSHHNKIFQLFPAAIIKIILLVK